MTNLHGQRLCVRLGASKTRKLLKHFGHGVRKVEALDRNRAVIIHTATGEHLRELETFLADVIEREDDETLSDSDPSP